MIYFDRVSKVYSDDSVALDEVSFSVEPGEFVSIVGHSGAGKTTLVKMLLAEERPTAGAVFFESMNVHEVPQRKIGDLRRKIGRDRIATIMGYGYRYDPPSSGPSRD